MEGDLTIELIVTGIGVAIVVAVLAYIAHRIALRLIHFWRQLS